MTSCQSVKVVYINKYIVPNINFPTFPALDREVHKDGSWTIPKESANLLAEFYIQYTAAESTYKYNKELFEKTKDDTE